MAIGIVKWFDNKKGFGFICCDDCPQDVFVHFSQIIGDGYRSLKHRDCVELDIVDGANGPQAHNVRVTAAERPAQADAGGGDSHGSAAEKPVQHS